MSGFCGYIGSGDIFLGANFLLESINLAKTMKVDSVSGDNFFFAVSYLEKSSVKGNRIHQTKDHLFLFSGDLIGHDCIPWQEIEENILSSNFNWFSKLKGFFSVSAYNFKQKSIYLIGDYFGQFPVYYGTIEDNFVFSSELATFSVLKQVPKFNLEWLYEYLFFQFAVDQTTFFEGINRIGPFSVVEFKSQNCSSSEVKYSDYFKKSSQLLKGEDALKKGERVFKEIIPTYYDQKDTNLVAFSGGFDSRTVLSLAPDEKHVKAYTYGVKGCDDLNKVEDYKWGY